MINYILNIKINDLLSMPYTCNDLLVLSIFEIW